MIRAADDRTQEVADDPDLTAVLDAWPRLAPDARRMLSTLATSGRLDAPTDAAREETVPPPTAHNEVQLGPGDWPILSSAWERHDDPELS
ncbi:hypothetical protein [Kribbella sp. CA-293567]|uniref:hypothetical protein n=1 Tax=Kribbella sp. CA-293567 TaxID=3002436 RepID=UPI0022DE4F78|nr:hypothetical protein [Kribbella sp. CA-293567]WBQ03040.1 hypothetical protein OX958_24020 [Kribbella sp. CA-293567]